MGLIDAMVYKLWTWMNTHKADANVHHTKYTDAEAVTAMGAIGDGNPLHHDKQQGRGFSSYLGNVQSIPNATYTTVIFDYEYFDTENEYSKSTGKYTPQTAGYYLCIGSVVFDTLADTKKFIIIVNKNTTMISVDRATVGGTDLCGGCVTAIAYMNGSTDYLVVQAYQNEGGAKNVLADRCWFSGWILPAP